MPAKKTAQTVAENEVDDALEEPSAENVKAARKPAPEPKPLNLDEMITVKNIADWTVGFQRVTSIGDVTIQAKGSARLTRNEVISQSQAGNLLINGSDRLGSHATIYIDDAATRAELGFDTPDRKQLVLSTENLKAVFDIKDDEEFKEEFKNLIVTDAEKYACVKMIRQLGVNDYRRVRFVEDHIKFTI